MAAQSENTKPETSQEGSTSTEAKKKIVSYRVGTYNVKNLFDRITDFLPEYMDPLGEADTDAKPRKEINTLARRINKSLLDTLALQEIESYKTLMDFKNAHLFTSQSTSKRNYPSKSGVFSMPSNDNRGIDLGVLSTRRFPIGKITSHRFKKTNEQKKNIQQGLLTGRNPVR